jgi:hypothetical protein
MSTHQNWFRSNIRQRLVDSAIDLKLDINPYPFVEMSFHEAADYTAKLIAKAHDIIYISLSGGADSEYTLRTFVRNDIAITPIIVETNGNTIELCEAHRICKELELTPIILKIGDEEYIRWYLRIVREIGGCGIYCIPSILACEYARDRGGVSLIGEHLIDTDKLKNKITPGANEWDFYNECFVGEEYTIPFFNYTVELAYAMIKRIEDVPLDIFKSALYGTKRRSIVDYNFSNRFNHAKSIINSLRKNYPNAHVDLGSKEEFLNVLRTTKNLS